MAGFTLKNGVPINYIEAIGLCEWMEVGFNTFYTFRGGEAAWIYAQVLRCLCALMGTTCVSVYPYQLGQDNDEALESGAFWFYRKLGFRPGRADLLRAGRTRRKENCRRSEIPQHPARTLKRLAAGHVFYEVNRNQARSNASPESEMGAWDRFSTRHIGLRVNRRMALEFGGDAISYAGTRRRSLNEAGCQHIFTVSACEGAFDNFALVLADVPELRAWTNAREKEDLVRIIRAKSKPDEMLYLRLTQQHARLRTVLLRLGQAPPVQTS